MLKQALPLLMLLGCPAAALSQAPSPAPQRAGPPEQGDSTPASAGTPRQLEEKLQDLIASQDAHAKEIQRLRNITGQHQQIMVSVTMCELSLSRVPAADFNVKGVDAQRLRATGLAEALSAGVLDEPGKAEDVRQAESRREAVCSRVLENDEALKKIVAALKEAGALKVLAESTLATVSGRPASLHVGGEIPVPVPQTNGAPTIELRDIGVTLDLVPVALERGRIQLDLRSRISEIDSRRSVVVHGVTAPALRVREVNTGVEMRAGQTFVLAGLVQQRATRNAPEESGDAGNEAHPELAPSIPAQDSTGPKQDKTEKTELVVMVRAEILTAPELVR